MRISEQLMGQFRELAELEYAVARGAMSRRLALGRARRRGLPEALLDDLRGASGQGLRAVAAPDSPINRRVRAVPLYRARTPQLLTRSAAAALVGHCSARLGVSVRLAWRSRSTHMDVETLRAQEIVVPGGVARAPGMSADVLTLMVAHEYAHLRLRSRDEALADYWAARYGLPLLWGDAATAERAVLAAYATVLFLARGREGMIEVLSADDAPVHVQIGGYPTLQSRWQLYKAGIFGLPFPRLVSPRVD